MTNRSTWDKEWKHETTGIRINVSSNITHASGDHTIDWVLELNTKSKRFIIRDDSRELGESSRDYMTPKDRVIKNRFIDIAKKMMRESNGFTTIKQFNKLVKKYKY